MNGDNVLSSGFTLAIEKVNGWGEGFYLILPNLVVGAVLLALFCLIALGVSRAVRAYFARKDRIDLGRMLSGFAFWTLVTLGFLVVMTIVIPSLKPVDLLASLGFGSIAFGFAFKDILQNWLAGLLILLRLPFRRGDQIVVNGAEGTVQAIEPRATILRTYDGRDIVIPNTTIYTNTVTINTSHAYRRVELDFTVGYAYDIRYMTEIIRAALEPIGQIRPDPPVQILCWELGATSLGIKIRWWIESERSAEIISRARVVQAIKEAFDANDIDPTDPQLVFYQQAGKPPLAAEQPGSGGTAEIAPLAKSPKAAPARTAPPPDVPLSPGDPENERPKIESKAETLLPEDGPRPV